MDQSETTDTNRMTRGQPTKPGLRLQVPEDPRVAQIAGVDAEGEESADDGVRLLVVDVDEHRPTPGRGRLGQLLLQTGLESKLWTDGLERPAAGGSRPTCTSTGVAPTAVDREGLV
jgi:hypothetical protein